MEIDKNEIYRNTYYGYWFDEVPVPENSGGGGGQGGDGVTKEEMDDAINTALNSITIGPKAGDDDTTEININGNTSEIDDVYLTGVERDEETNEVVFNLNNGKDPIRVNADELDNPNIDGSTF